ncbi:MAG: nucleotide exchange factor GrpE [Candidatus Caldatribacterium sp.]|uniref:nucleotide exchange factor GrpE n=1 Tax=Candidatus Caldatribacterium sp. TaxID=2282143 RepID=UPI00299099D2|nr:nucleotide exchange factor GrpE [Candidatus Caldatribacterium sp.]MCX7731242.1 nucleotide exchange factor GrpE [Candidatus Caldatribacterium sp.]MDW8081417.1 nucleotide exchange factor GrpE [Candidatus Calescibacterium sp.]
MEKREELAQAMHENQQTGESVNLQISLQEEVEKLKTALEEEKRRVSEKEQLISEYLNDLKRVKADFDNFRKREMLYRQQFVKTANRDLILKILPIIDDLEKALFEGQKNEVDVTFLQGVELIYRKFLSILEKEGVRPVETKGQKFDPKYHEAIATVSLPDHEDFVIVEEVRKGYLYHDEVLRPAQVKVNRISQEKMA